MHTNYSINLAIGSRVFYHYKSMQNQFYRYRCWFFFFQHRCLHRWYLSLTSMVKTSTSIMKHRCLKNIDDDVPSLNLIGSCGIATYRRIAISVVRDTLILLRARHACTAGRFSRVGVVYVFFRI